MPYYCDSDSDSEDRTYDEWLKIVKEYGLNFRYVPKEFKTYEMCLAAVQHNGDWSSDDELMITLVPDEHKTYEMYLTSVKGHYYSLGKVPKEHFTAEIFIAAMEQATESVETIDQDNFTTEFFTEYLCELQGDIDWIPTRCDGMTHDLYLFVVQKTPEYLKWVPEEFRSEELCLTAVRQNYDLIRYITNPAVLRNDDWAIACFIANIENPHVRRNLWDM